MSFAMASALTLQLLAFALFLQSLELVFITRSPVFKSVWRYENIRQDLERGLPLPNGTIGAVFSTRGFTTVLILQLLLALAAFVVPCSGIFVALTIGHLLICLRFRGSFNGGSDMMTFVALTGALIITFGTDERTQRLGLLYIAIQAIYSYAKSGFAKMRERDWRNGTPLSPFLSRSLFTDIKRVGVMLRFKPGIARGFTWAVLIFEVSALALPFCHQIVPVYFAFAVIFHFAIYRAFGLNRFFWIWLTAWPSIFYLSVLF